MQKKLTKILSIVFYGIFLSFILGQLQRFQVNTRIAVYLHEILMVVFIFIWGILLTHTRQKPRVPDLAYNGLPFIAIVVLSLLVNLPNYGIAGSFIGFLYGLRFLLLILFMIAVYDSFQQKLLKIKKDQVVAFSLAAILIGLFQYVFLPDTRILYQLGWDDHLNRLIGTYFDPGFTGLVFTLIFVFLYTLTLKKKESLKVEILMLLSFITVFLTYSRASMVAFGVTLLVSLVIYPKKKRTLQLLACAFLLVLLLPRTEGEGVNLQRSYSIQSRIETTVSAKDVFMDNFLFGIGFNNYPKLSVIENLVPYHPSAPDNSYLFVLATTGILGGVAFAYWLLKSLIDYRKEAHIFLSIVAVSSHALFNNSWFYTFVLTWFGLILWVSFEKK